MATNEALGSLGEKIVAGLGSKASGHAVAFDQLTVTVQAEQIVEVVKYLRDDPACRFVNIIDITAVDYPGREKRFDVVYHLLSPTLNTRIRLRAEADETTQVPSIIDVFPGRGLVRARDLRPLWRDLHRPSRHAPPPDRLRL